MPLQNIFVQLVTLPLRVASLLCRSAASLLCAMPLRYVAYLCRGPDTLFLNVAELCRCHSSRHRSLAKLHVAVALQCHSNATHCHAFSKPCFTIPPLADSVHFRYLALHSTSSAWFCFAFPTLDTSVLCLIGSLRN